MRRFAALLVVLTVLAPLGVRAAGAASDTGTLLVEGDRNGGYWAFVGSATGRLSLERRDRDGFNNDIARAVATDATALAYDAAADVLWYADGGAVHRYVERPSGITNTVVATVTSVSGMDVGPDGTLYLVDQGQVRQLAAGGSVVDVPGTTDLLAGDVAVAADGALLVLADRRLWRVQGGARSALTAASSGCLPPDPCGDGGPASAARLDSAVLDAAADGRIYIGEGMARRVRVIDPHGVIRTFAGGPSAPIEPVVSLTVSGADLVYVTKVPTGGPTTLVQVRDAATAAPDAQGYRLVAGDGGVFAFGAARFGGSTGGRRLAQPVLGGASHGGGYWLVARDGGVFSFGLPFLGSAAGKTTSPVVGLVSLPETGGYWVVERNGHLHEFGVASDFQPVTSGPVVGAAPTGFGGLFVATADGQVETRGSSLVPGRGRVSGLTAPVVGIAALPDGEGWWLVTADGRVVPGGAAPALGSMTGKGLNAPIVGIVATRTGSGYWLVGADGGVFSFGDARFLGSTGSRQLNQPIVGAIAG